MESPGSPSSPGSPRQHMQDNNFKVVIRVRPPLPRELHNAERPFQNAVRVDDEHNITISENLPALDEGGWAAVGPYSTHSFAFDHVYDQQCDQRKVYETTAKAVVESSLKGYNATIFAYGQTGTGKTYTMEGFNSAEERGIIPRAIEQIFRHIQTSVSPRMRFLVRASYLQIYNEVISDLLKPERSNLAIREDKKKGVFVEGLSEWVVRSPAEIYGLMERGGAVRATGSTRMNELSSRSHAVFIIIAEQSETTYLDEAGREMSVEEFARLVKSRAHGDAGLKALEANVRQSFKVGKLNLVDLAGSERVRLTGATGQRLEESKKINQSLSALGNVISALTDTRGRQHIPYRDSKLTRILEDSLGGNCKTTMMAMISPALEAFLESLSTLKFANRAKNIKNEARINEDMDQKSLLRRYERELKRLRQELEERSRAVVDQRRLLELDEQRRRAEEDKMAAIRALEARSKEFMKEKAEKKRLEDAIVDLQSRMLMGGGLPQGNLTEIPAFRNALKEHQERIRAEYDARVAELEKERESIEEEKAQVDRYKQLLLKQRDIMILLTQRLNERDEQIMALQDELDAYDRHQRELEEKLDEKTAALIHLQRVSMEVDSASPQKSSALQEALGAWAGREGEGGAAAMPRRRLEGGGGEGGGGRRVGGEAAPTPQTLLITTRQYAPHEGSLVAGGAGAGPVAPTRTGEEAAPSTPAAGRSLAPSTTAAGVGPAASSSSAAPSSRGGGAGATTHHLLSAEEKIAELNGLLDAAASDRDKMQRDLEDTQAEKVSMEFLLRERLEKLVQSEIESRLARGGKGLEGEGTAEAALHARSLQSQLSIKESQLASVREEQARALEDVAGLRTRLERATAGGGGGGAAGDPALARRLAVLEKERTAISAIMEGKVAKLVDSIAGALSGSPGAASARWSRELTALQRLVHASVAALKQSDEQAAGGSAATPKTPSVQ